MTEAEKKELTAKIGALLFAAAEPVTVEKLAKFLKLEESICFELLEELKKKYLEANLGVDVLIDQKKAALAADKFQSETIAKFIGREIREEISPSALEVLSIVAYRGPVSRLAIDEIRGVNSGAILRSLAIRGLVERKENPDDSRSFLYQTSFDFLKNLGLDSVAALPDYQRLSQKEIFVKKEEAEDRTTNEKNNTDESTRDHG